MQKFGKSTEGHQKHVFQNLMAMSGKINSLKGPQNSFLKVLHSKKCALSYHFTMTFPFNQIMGPIIISKETWKFLYSLLNFRLYDLVLLGATIFVVFGPATKDVLKGNQTEWPGCIYKNKVWSFCLYLTLVGSRTVESGVPLSEDIGVARTVFAPKN